MAMPPLMKSTAGTIKVSIDAAQPCKAVKMAVSEKREHARCSTCVAVETKLLDSAENALKLRVSSCSP